MAKVTKASLSKKKGYTIGDKEILYFSTEEFKIYAGIAGFRVYKNDDTGALSCKAFKTQEELDSESGFLFRFKCNQNIDFKKPLCVSMQKGNFEDACLLNSKVQEQTVLHTF